jgi:hypothetical protein
MFFIGFLWWSDAAMLSTISADFLLATFSALFLYHRFTEL